MVNVKTKEIPEKYERFRDECEAANAIITPPNFCMFNKLEVLNIERDVNDRAMKEMLVEITDLGYDVIDEIVSECKNTSGDTNEESAANLDYCLRALLRHYGVEFAL
ncbi:hypothetical protein JTB14_019083 [Gonioctena quinquepunctata]|nr:hypothetical protein JTB14_019083 [Gonioctena quinquepunctata]